MVDTKAGLTQVLCKQNDLVCVDVIIITFLWTNQRNVHVGLACFLVALDHELSPYVEQDIKPKSRVDEDHILNKIISCNFT